MHGLLFVINSWIYKQIGEIIKTLNTKKQQFFLNKTPDFFFLGSISTKKFYLSKKK
jgi:hypothetical protein